MRIFPLGESAVTVEFGNEISLDLNARAIAVAQYLDVHPFPGYIECVPAYASVTVFFDLGIVRENSGNRGSAFDTVCRVVRHAAEQETTSEVKDPGIVEIPVRFDPDAALDLEFVSQYSGLKTDDLIETFLGRTYRVFMLGFLPGFAYMGEVDALIAAPRKQTPRLRVPKGSVGIAGRQTGIYPLESPGGWQIIGRTGLEMFAPGADDPCLLRPGDLVKFTGA